MRVLNAVAIVLLLGSACVGEVGELQAPSSLGGTGAESPTSPNDPSSPTAPTVPTNPNLPGLPSVSSFECTPAQGFAPLDAKCVVLAAHSKDQPVRCELTVSDGRALLEIADCRTQSEQVLNFAMAGTFTLTLRALDSAGASVNATATLKVEPKPNAAPSIASFDATPTTGGAPLKTTLKFAVTDPDGDPLTCALDVGADGSFEYPNVDCTAGVQSHTVATAGAVSVKLVVKDNKGLSAEQSLTLTAKAAVGDLKISKVEWGQSVIAEQPKLVANKPALLRVYVLADKAGLQGVVVKAEGVKADGTSLGALMLTGPATPPTADAPADLTQQYRATVPAAWVAPGVEIKLAVDPADALPETDETNNLRSVKPSVGKPNSLAFTAVPVVSGGRTGASVNIEPIMTATWPLASVNTQVRAAYTFGGTLASGGTGWDQLLQQIASVRQADGSSRNYYGFAKVTYGSGVAGIGYIGQEAATGRDDSLSTVAHELGHNMGRQHAPCGGPAGPDPQYPYAGAKLGSWGYDATTQKLVNPATTFDLMSYCEPEWVSDFNYNKVQTFLEGQPQANVSGAAPDMALLIAGQVINGRANFQPVVRMQAFAAPLVDSSYVVSLALRDGSTRQVPVKMYEIGDSESGAQHFQTVIADPGSIASIELLQGSVVLGRMGSQPLGGSPVHLSRVDQENVRMIWNAKDGAQASIAHISADGVRTTLSLWRTGGDAEVRVSGLTGGVLEVSQSNGTSSQRTTFDAW